MLVSRFGIFISAIRFRLNVTTKTIGVTEKIQQFIFKNKSLFNHENIKIPGESNVHIRNYLEVELEVTRDRVRTESVFREYLKLKIKLREYTRPYMSQNNV